MSARIELIVAVIDKTAKPINQTGGAAAIHDQFNSDKTGFSLVIQTAQTTATVGSVLSASHFPLGAVPFINIATNTLAGTVTFLRITADLHAGNELKKGDIVSLAGNIAGVVGSFAILLGAPYIVAGAGVVAAFATLYSVFDSDLAKAAHDKLIPLFSSLLNQLDTTVPDTPLIAPDLTFASPDRILSGYQGLITSINWNPESSEITLGTKEIGFVNNHQFNTQATGAEHSPPAPAFTPPTSDATLTISIDSLNGVPSPEPAPQSPCPLKTIKTTMSAAVLRNKTNTTDKPPTKNIKPIKNAYAAKLVETNARA